MEAITRRDAILAGIGGALPDDSTRRVLARKFSRPDLSYLLLHAPSRRVIASRWSNPRAPVPVGSLVKPFLAFAHRGSWPDIVCRGSVDQCWKPSGHGRLKLPEAIAFSCNAYFLELARTINPAALVQLGLPAPQQPTLETWIGVGTKWPIAPLTVVSAYCELVARANGDILQGMRLSARSGTSREIRCDALAKTGTASCHHEKRSPGDGYAIAVYPATAPRLALLASLDGAPGAHAAKVCGEMIRSIE